MSNNPFADNPYQPPAMAATPASAANLSGPDHDLLKKFRQQMHALGGLWIFLGVLAFGAGVAVMTLDPDSANDSPVLVVILFISGIVHLGLGAATCAKQMWAVYVGLVLSYISVIGNIINLNLCALAIMIAVIVQAHRVINWSRLLKQSGIPLATKV